MNERQRAKFEERYGYEPEYILPNGPGIIDHNIWLRDMKAYSAACQDEAEAAQGLVKDAERALEAWDSTVLPSGHDGMMQERMECLRAALLDFKGDAK